MVPAVRQSWSKVLGTPGINLWRNFPLLATATKLLFFGRHSPSPPNRCWAKHVRMGWTTFLHRTWNLLIKLDSVPTNLSRTVESSQFHILSKAIAYIYIYIYISVRYKFTATRWRVRHNMLLWFVKRFYESNLKKLQFTTQRFDTPV